MTKDEALKLALEALKDACGERCNAEYNPCFQREAITAIEKCLANDALEKKAENARELGLDYEPVATNDTSQERVAETAKQRHEPVIDKSAAIRIATALGWTPPRQWVGLTDEDHNEILLDAIRHKWLDRLIVKQIEAKLKEKNA